MAESDASKKARKVFNVARALALDSYAHLEAALGLLFASTLGTKPPYATFILSKIVNARARNEVVQRIVDLRTAKSFRLFTNSLFGHISEVDHLRNQLVHWRVQQSKAGNFVLKPTDMLSDSTVAMDKAAIDALSYKCLFLVQVITTFSRHLGKPKDSALEKRFKQPLQCPPEREDLFFPLYPPTT